MCFALRIAVECTRRVVPKSPLSPRYICTSDVRDRGTVIQPTSVQFNSRNLVCRTRSLHISTTGGPNSPVPARDVLMPDDLRAPHALYRIVQLPPGKQSRELSYRSRTRTQRAKVNDGSAPSLPDPAGTQVDA